jgi:hypothetical protein
MSDSDRDTHFANYASLLFQDMQADIATLAALQANQVREIRLIESRIQQRITERAYDFAYHLLMHTTPASGSTIKQFVGLDIPDMIPHIPDMADFPQEGQTPGNGTLPKRYRC